MIEASWRPGVWAPTNLLQSHSIVAVCPLTLSLLMKLKARTEIVIAFPVHLLKHQQQWQGNGHAELSN